MLKSNTSELSQMESTAIRSTSISPTSRWLQNAFTLLLIITQFGAPVLGNSHELLDEVALLQGNNEPAIDDSTPDLLDEVKRSWQSLQGSWGKRDHGAPVEGDDYDMQVPEWSSTGITEFAEHPDVMKYSIIYAPSPNALAAAVSAAASSGSNTDPNGESSTGFEKKSWKNMNVAWGKRRSAVWNKFRGAWGKREPGWNNLKGMWGKRSSGDWKKLQSAWGKRSLQQ